MTATAEPPASTAQIPRVEAGASATPDRADGIELLGCVHGCGYRDHVSLVRRADGQIVQLGPLLYGLLECIDGQRDVPQLSRALSEKLRRGVEDQHVLRLAQKLGQQGLLAGTEQQAPPKRNPLLALRWKVLVTNPVWTRRLTAPLAFLFRPWIMWPVVAAFAGVFWFVLIQKGVASATAQAFHQPALLLLVFALAVASAGIHELGHAAACKYGGATPGGMGMGIYLVWPAFYTDVTETYKLPKRSRLRVDLAGLYFNALIADLTMAVWLVVRTDALLLLIALQVLQMVKQLSPVIRADGYHILSDATGVPDLFSHIGPTLRRLLPGHRHEPSALTGRARAIVSVWVLVVVPVLLSLAIGAILVLPHVATSAWDSGRAIATSMPGQVSHAQVIDLLSSLVQLLALLLPVLGSLLVTQKVARMAARHGRNWSRGSIPRGIAVTAAALLAMTGVGWAWWPSGQYRPVPNKGGTIVNLARLVTSPVAAARPAPPQALLTPGTHLAVSMVPVGGATAAHPALHVILGNKGPVAILGGGRGYAGAATAFRFHFSGNTGPNSTATVVGNKRGAVKYNVVYSLVTVSRGAPVTSRNTAIAVSHCKGCMSVAVSFQVVLVVGQSNVIAPINAAEALNKHCPACTTVAMADQMVVTLKKQPSGHLLTELRRALKRLHALSKLRGRLAAGLIVQTVAAIQRKIQAELLGSGLMTNPPRTSTTSATSTTPSTSSNSGGGSTTSSSSGTTSGSTPSSSSGSGSGGAVSGSTGVTSTPTSSTQTTSTDTTTTTSSSATTTTSSSTAG
jgi:putative peptide zinc metalloprotease protein